MAKDYFNFPNQAGPSEVFYLEGTGQAAGNDWVTWEKPLGKTMCDILLVGKGGNGGTGVIGAAGVVEVVVGLVLLHV